MSSVVLGFSGGIDSTAAVDFLRDKGYKVVALTMDMCGDSELVTTARNKAAELGVEFESIDCQALFDKEIKQYFISEYRNGRTPAPCTRCNPHIKWRLLLEYANKHNIDHIATGHYFRVVEFNGKKYVARARDSKKDQSYYLWDLSQEVLSRAITPLADKIKEEVKQSSTLKRESMGVCFLRGKRYSEYIDEMCGTLPAGDIVDKSEEVVSQHKGIAHYTIGQKRGEGIPPNSVVIAIDNTRNRLVVGEDADLHHSKLFIRHCNFVDHDEVLNSKDITLLVRGLGRNPSGYVQSVVPHEDGYQITLSSLAWACASGQPVVLYREDRVIGGGYLEYSSK